MGLADGFKDLYYKWEDKWYGFLDKVQERIPVYKVIDPIDKVVPSFALFSGIILILVGWGLFALVFGTIQQSVFSVQIVDADGQPVEGINVSFSYNETTDTFPTNQSGSTAPVTVTPGTNVTVSFFASGFGEIEKNYTTEGGLDRRRIPLTERDAGQRVYRFQVLDSLNRPVDTSVRLEFDCSNASATAPDDQTVFESNVEVPVPNDCGQLSVKAYASGYDSGSRQNVSDGGQILLAGEETGLLPAGSGELNVNLTFNSLRVLDLVNVQVYKSTLGEGVKYDSGTSVSGEINFVLPAGNYYIVTDATTKYASARTLAFLVQEGQTISVDVALSGSVDGFIKVKPVDKISGAELDDTGITVKKDGQEVCFVTTTEQDSTVQCGGKESEEYTLIGYKEGYCREVKENVLISDNVITLKMTRDTGQCGGKLQAVVKDQDGNPVADAKVSLFDDERKSLGFLERITNSEGEAVFSGVQTGSYKVFAYKGQFSGWSDAQRFVRDFDDETLYEVSMLIPDGTIRVVVKNEDGEPEQFSTVLLVDGITWKAVEGPLPVTSPDGVLDIVTKADKDVFAVVTKNDFADFTSRVYNVKPESVQEINVTLEPEIISGDLDVKFLGLFKGDLIAQVVQPGKEYAARFQLRIPENKGYDELGLHVRTGHSNAMETDEWFIKKLNAPEASDERSTAFNPEEGQEHDEEFVSRAGSKWVNILWHDFDNRTGIIESEVIVKVKENAGEEPFLPLRWRAWGEDGGEIIRSPKDNSLGTSSSASDLYANTNGEEFEVGSETLCSDVWCFNANILDVSENLVETVSDSYTAKHNTLYKLTFSVLNNSQFDTDSFNDAQLQIINDDEAILIGEYSVTGADGSTITNDLSDYETPLINAGDVKPRKDVSGYFFFKPELSVNSDLVLQVRSGNRIRFEKTITVDILAPNSFNMEFEHDDKFSQQPPILKSGIEQNLRVRASDAANGEFVQNADIKAKNRFGDVLVTATTNELGIGVLSLPALEPGEPLTVSVEKAEFETLEETVNVDSRVVVIDPNSLGVSLNTKTVFSQQKFVVIKNETELDLKIKKVEIEGDFRGYLDETGMQDWLDSQYSNNIIEAEEDLPLTLNFSLSELGKSLAKTESLDGFFNVEVTTGATDFVESIPVKMSIGVGGEVDNPNCFVVTKRNWETGTEGSERILSFEIENNCAIKGQPVPLKNLSAMVKWNSNHVGDFSLQVGASQQAGPSQIELTSGFFKLVRNIVEAGESIPASLTFVPDGGVLGEANATIIIRADNEKAGGAQVLEDKINAKIDVINLTECIRFDRDIVNLKEGKDSKFKVETKSCGGKVDFKFESPLDIDPPEITLQATDSKSITILADEQWITGQYPIYVLARGTQDTQFSLRKLIRARIPSTGCFELSSYEYDIYDSADSPYDGFDVGILTNRCKETQVDVTIQFDERDWMKAMEEGLKWGLVGGVLGLLNDGDLDDIFDDLLGKKKKDNVATQPESSSGEETSEEENEETPEETETIEEQQSEESQGFLVDGYCGAVEGGIIPDFMNLCGEEKAVETSTPTEAPIEQPVLTGSEALMNEALEASGLPISLSELESDYPNDYDLFKNTVETENEGANFYFDGTRFWTVNQVLDKIHGELVSDAARENAPTATNETVATEEQECPEGQYWNPNNGTCEEEVEFAAENESLLREPVGLFVFAGNETGIDSEEKITEESENVVASVNPVGFISLGGIFEGGGIGNVWDILTEMVADPLTGFTNGFLIGTLLTYFDMESGTIQGTVIVEDINVSTTTPLELLEPPGRNDIPLARNITVMAGEERTQRNLQDIALRQGRVELIFENAGNEVQDNPFTPIFGVLKVTGEEIEYVTNYSNNNRSVLAEGKLREKERKDYSEKFHIQFNSFSPEEQPPELIETKSCQIRNLRGETGINARPKVLMEWNWSDVQENACDSDGLGNYCDATQFSITLLKKIKEINDFLETSAPFECPTSTTALSEAEQDLDDFSKDVAITGLKAQPSANDYKLTAELASNNQFSMDVDVEFVINRIDTTTTVTCEEGNEQTVNMTSFRNVECTLVGINNGEFEATVNITPDLSSCSGGTCLNGDLDNDDLSLTFATADQGEGLQQCEPYSTARLGEFMAATGLEDSGILKKTSFNANLMRDGYTHDFQKDFHEFATTKAFFQTPGYYESEGLGEYFSNPDLFKFDSPLLVSPNSPLPAGKYRVTIDITYDDDSWELFENDQPNAKITVELEKLATPQPDSPFYYLPFNGLVGVDTANGRQGYGVNYVQGTQEEIRINDDVQQLVVSESIPNSNPVQNGLITTRKIEDFRTLNMDNRGIVLDVSRTGSTNALTFSPGRASPLLMKVTGGDSDKAYAFYSMNLGGTPQDIGSSLTVWDGITRGCKDFLDQELSEHYLQRTDVQGGVGLTECSGTFDQTEYGLEWCNTKNSGDVYLQTVFFTPLNKTATLSMISSQDDAVFYDAGSNETTQVDLDQSAQTIDNVKAVLDLITSEDVCVNGFGNGSAARFFWNPEKIINGAYSGVKAAIPASCIQ